MTAIVYITGILFFFALVGLIRPFGFISNSKRWHYGLSALAFLVISGGLAGAISQEERDQTDGSGAVADDSREEANLDGQMATKPRYVAADFYWDADVQPYQIELLAAANRIVAENDQCESINANGVTRSQSQGTAANPIYFVTCQMEDGPPFNVFFERDAAENRDSFSAVAHIDKGTALIACERHARSAAANPQTVEFSTFVDAGFRKFPNGRTILSSTFTSQNSFGVSEKFEIICPFDGTSLGTVTVRSKRP